MPYDETLADRVRSTLSRRKLITEKRMFGGMAFLLGGNMCVGVWKEYLILRLGVEGANAILDGPHVRPFDITGKPMRGWAMIEPAVTLHADQVKEWVDLAINFVKTLPPK